MSTDGRLNAFDGDPDHDGPYYEIQYDIENVQRGPGGVFRKRVLMKGLLSG